MARPFSQKQAIPGRQGAAQTDDQPERTFQEKIVLYTKRASVWGLAASLLVHLLAWLVASIITFTHAQAGGAGAGDSLVEFAVVTETELQQLQDASLEVQSPEVPDIPLEALPALDELGGPVSSDMQALMDDIGELGSDLGAGDINDAGALGAGGAGGAASFFGVEARGSRFAYVVDVSGSMGVGGKIQALKKELSRSVGALEENTSFSIALYSGSAWPLGQRKGWVNASTSGKKWASKHIRDIIPNGGTNPSPAFGILFQMSPKPEAIYFMTDGEFPAEAALEILRINGDYNIPIHCITFVNRAAEPVMRQIADESGGTYNHVPGPDG